MIRVASFDVFETVVTRRVRGSEFLFLLVGQALQERRTLLTSTGAFANARDAVELRLLQAGQHPSLVDIYDKLLDAGLVRGSPLSLAEVEEHVDRALIVPIPGALRALQKARQAGKKICFVSETYHCERFLKDLLEKLELAQVDEPVFTSSERQATKQDGSLYRVMAGQMGAAFDQIAHTGDHSELDVAAPMRLDIAGHLAPVSPWNHYEDLLEREAHSTGPYTACLSAASRLARLSVRSAPVGLSELLPAVGPMLLAYTDWALNLARRLDLEQLVFVSRDGQILHRIAQARSQSSGPILTYLYGGRAAFSSTQSGVVQAAFVAYLGSLGIGPLTRWGLVDLGWQGRSGADLRSVLRRVAYSQPTLFYFGLYGRPADLGADVHCFNFDLTNGRTGLSAVPGLQAVLETVCAGDHGQTLSYAMGAGGVGRPVLATDVNGPAIEWGVREWQDMVAHFASLAPSVPPCESGTPIGQAAVFVELLRRPGRREAEALARAPFSNEPDGSDAVSLAHPVGWIETAQALVGRPLKGFWWPGRVAVTPGLRGAMLRSTRALRSAVRSASGGTRPGTSQLLFERYVRDRRRAHRIQLKSWSADVPQFEPIKILMVTSLFDPHVGGIEAVTGESLRRLAARGHRVELVSWRWPDKLPMRGSCGDLSFLRLRFPQLIPFRLSRTTMRQLANVLALLVIAVRQRPDVIHLQGTDVHAAYGAVVARLLRRPCVLTLHGEVTAHLPDQVARNSQNLAFLGRTTSMITAPTAEMAAAAYRRLGVPLAAIRIIRNGVDTAVFSAPQEARTIDVVSVGRMAHEKGFDVLVKALGQLHRSGRSMTCRIVGVGPKDDLTRLIARESLQDCVTVLDGANRPAVVAAVRQARMYCQPSRTEGLPVALLEAMAAGCCIVATQVGGIPSVITPEVDGLLVPADDHLALAEALERADADVQMRTRIAAAAQTRAAFYSWEVVVRDWEQLYRAVISSHRERRLGASCK